MTLRNKKNIARAAVTLMGSAMMMSSASADQVILDDLIVDGSACIGFDCVNGESFGFDTIRIKENNLRIRAVDTSNSASFPTQDWQITFNDSSNGGANKFSIDAISPAVSTPFTILSGAPTNSLFVNASGKIGFGTATPVVDLHVVSGNTPTLRLEQDGSSGFTPQTWDLAGNEANFFIRDATNGSTLPFRIQPGAPSESIYIAATGRVGFGEASPDDSIHIKNVESAAGGFIGLTYEKTSTNAAVWRTIFDPANDRFLITKTASGGSEMIISGGTGDVTIRGGLVTGTAGSCEAGTPCDRVFDEDYVIPSIKEHADEMWAKKHLPVVGPTKAGEPINVTVKLTRMLNELEKAHIYIAELHDRLEKSDGRLAILEARTKNSDKME